MGRGDADGAMERGAGEARSEGLSRRRRAAEVAASAQQASAGRRGAPRGTFVVASSSSQVASCRLSCGA